MLKEATEENKILNNPRLKINYNLNLLSQYEENNLAFTNIIQKSDEKKNFKYLLEHRRNVIYFYNKITNNIIDEKSIFIIRKMVGDRNYYYRSLSFYLINSHNFHVYFINYIHNYIKINISKLEPEYPYINRNDKNISLNEYMQNININDIMLVKLRY